MAQCKLIRVDPDVLRQSSGAISSVTAALQQIGKELMHSANDAPSYEGQFGPVVTVIGLSALAGAKIHSSRFEGQAVSLSRRAGLFQVADNAAIKGLQILSPVQVAYLEYIKRLSVLTSIPVEQLLKLLRLGGLFFPTIVLPVWILWIGIVDLKGPKLTPVLPEETVDAGEASPVGAIVGGRISEDESTYEQPNSYAHIVLNQYDENWKDDEMGVLTGGLVGEYGCLITCIAMIARLLGYEDATTKDVNDYMRDNEGYKKDSSELIWAKAIDYLKSKTGKETSLNDKINKSGVTDLLRSGTPVIVHLPSSVNPQDGHWVLAVGIDDDNNYIVLDPLTGEQRTCNPSELYNGGHRAFVIQ